MGGMWKCGNWRDVEMWKCEECGNVEMGGMWRWELGNLGMPYSEDEGLELGMKEVLNRKVGW